MDTQATFANSFWGENDEGMKRLVEHMHHSKQTCEEILAFYKERAAMEQEYAQKLSGLAKRALGLNELGTLKYSLETIRTSTETMAKSHFTTARQIHEQIQGPLETFAASMRDRRKTCEDTMLKLTKAKSAQNAAVEKARSRYEAECHKVSGFQAQRNLLVGTELSKVNAKLDKSQVNVLALQRQYQDALKVLTEVTERWNSDWRQMSDRFQDLEEEKINFLKSNLWAYANALSTVCVSDDEGCEQIRVALEKCEAAKDIETFISAHGTGSKILDPPEFTNYLQGFTRSSDQGRYQIAHFTRGDDSYKQQQEPEQSSSFQVLNGKTSRAPQRDPYLEPTQTQDGYISSSPAFSDMSHSTNTSVSTTSQRNEKRKSWAQPFKRKSAPDLSRVWKSTSSYGSFTGSFEQEHHERMDHGNETTQPSGKDPLLAALERLKAAPEKNTGSPYGNGKPTNSFGVNANNTPQRQQVSPQRQPPQTQRQPPAQVSPQRQQFPDQRDNNQQPQPRYRREQLHQVQSRPRAKSMVLESGPEGLPLRTSDGLRIVKYARAQYDYRASIPEEVSFHKGDILLVTFMQEDGWWDAEVYNKWVSGLAPSNFLVSI